VPGRQPLQKILRQPCEFCGPFHHGRVAAPGNEMKFRIRQQFLKLMRGIWRCDPILSAPNDQHRTMYVRQQLPHAGFPVVFGQLHYFPEPWPVAEDGFKFVHHGLSYHGFAVENFPDVAAQPFAVKAAAKDPHGFRFIEAATAGEHQPDNASGIALGEVQGQLAAKGIAHDHHTPDIFCFHQLEEKPQQVFLTIRQF